MNPKYQKDQSLENNLSVVKLEGGWRSLKYMNCDFISEEICMIAVTQNWRALNSVARPTPEMVWVGLEQSPKAILYSLYPTDEMMMHSVTRDGLMLSHLDRDTDQSNDICLAAVTQNGYALQFVSDEFASEEVCLAAVDQNSEAIKLVKNPEIRMLCHKNLSFCK